MNTTEALAAINGRIEQKHAEIAILREAKAKIEAYDAVADDLTNKAKTSRKTDVNAKLTNFSIAWEP